MIYADTDFFIALVKDDDWLQERAAAIATEHEGDIYTSRATLLELLMISDRFKFDRMEALSYALEIAPVPEDETGPLTTLLTTVSRSKRHLSSK
jgi:predicted nucleic acid-binding protein